MPEQIPNQQIEKEKPRPLSESEELVYQTLLPRLEKLAINPDDFKEKDRQKNIKADKEKILQRKEGLKQAGQSDLNPSKKRSKILEALMAEQIEMSDWFGHNVNTVIASEFDDLFNSIDMVIEFGSEDEKDTDYNPLGIDVTSTTERIEKKLIAIRDHFRQWGGSRIKYFRSERRNPKTTLKELPRLIMGAEPELIEELCILWLKANKHRLDGKNPLGVTPEERSKLREAGRLLAHHRIVNLLLEELELQLLALVEFAKKHKKNPNKLERLLIIIEELLKLRKVDPVDSVRNSRDKIYQALRAELEKIFPESRLL